MTGTFFGNVDLAQVALYLFWIFFFGLVIYLQRENMREGYPLEDADGSPEPAVWPMPAPKTFILPGDLGTITVPDADRERTLNDRPLAMSRVTSDFGSPYEPTGNPLVDGVGPASYAMRADQPERDGHNQPKIRPMRDVPSFSHAGGRDPRGAAVISADGEVVGKVTDLWIDVPEMAVRYLEAELATGGTRLIPMPLAKLTWRGVRVHSLYAEQFAGVPAAKSAGEVTKLEEDKICAYYGGGKLYASPARTGPVLEGAEA